MRATVTPTAAFGRRSKYSFRAFYITTCIISILSVLSLVADQFAKYRHGEHNGENQRRAMAELDGTQVWKSDEAVSHVDAWNPVGSHANGW